MKGKGLRVLLIVLSTAVCAAAALAGAYYGLVATAENTEEAWRAMEPVDLSRVADGVYSGRAGAFICSVELNVTVKDRRIAGIEIVREVNGGGKYRAEGLPARIVEAQTPDVDAVSGATLTSRTIMVAVYEALRGQPK